MTESPYLLNLILLLGNVGIEIFYDPIKDNCLLSMKEINPNDVAEKYNNLKVIWDENDKWHIRTKSMIYDFIIKSLKSIHIDSSSKILNAGSAGYSYGIDERNILHIDIAKGKISHCRT